MTKTLVIVASLFPIAASAAVPVLTPKPQAPSEQSSAAVVSTHGMWRFEQLSMGPDPGGHTGATVTPETSKTGQPSQDAAAASNQSGAKSNDAGGANAAKQPADNSGGKSSVPPAAPTTSSTAGQTQPSKER